MATPVVLVHGWGGSFAYTWEASGFTELLRDAGRPVIGVDLLGHGEAPKPHDPAEYADLTRRVLDAIPDEPVDAIGFSLGAITLLRIAIDQPHRFSHLVLAGIGATLFDDDPTGTERIVAALEGSLKVNEQTRADIGPAADAAVATEGMGLREHLLRADQERPVGTDLADDFRIAGKRLQIAARILEADDLREVGKTPDQLRLEHHLHHLRHVVEKERQREARHERPAPALEWSLACRKVVRRGGDNGCRAAAS
jgi:pimeloyl-ACP methyl ester carboxylesterase